MRKKLLQMFALQQDLNDTTNGIGWEEGKTKEGRDINWKLYIFMKTAAFIDFFNWKHWKDIGKEPDWESAKMELVDIWYFLMSEKIRDYRSAPPSIRMSPGSFDNSIMKVFGDFMIEYLDGKDGDAGSEIIGKAENFIYHISQPASIDFIMLKFSHLCKAAGLSFDDLYELYMAKSVLNAEDRTDRRNV